VSFQFIVASGTRSALPHGIASDKLVEAGDFVVFDYGNMVNGYCSDMTRTVVVGEATDQQKEIYDTVLKAQMASLEAVQPRHHRQRAGPDCPGHHHGSRLRQLFRPRPGPWCGHRDP
jgi:Xaa-Pro aminopeptidase